MTGNARQLLDIEHALRRNPSPLPNCLGRDPKGFANGRKSAASGDGPFKSGGSGYVVHASKESMAFIFIQAILSWTAPASSSRPFL